VASLLRFGRIVDRADPGRSEGATMFTRADLHMHTTASDGTMSPQALVNAVLIHQHKMKEPVLRVIAITDHDTLAGAWTALEFHKALHAEAELEIIPGAEISSADGHIIALNISKNISKHMSAAATIAAIHDQGGLAIAVHPYAYFPFIKGFKGIRGLIADPVVGRAVDAVEVRNANPTEILNNHFTHWINRRHLKRPEVGGSDLHFLSAMARAGTVFPGRTADDLIRAIHEGTTRAVGSVYGPLALYQYARDRLAWKQFCLEDPIVRVFHDW
jgi:predicted metal-dependent phosphoesterase TrpH